MSEIADDPNVQQSARDVPKAIGHALFWIGAVSLSGLLWVAAIRIVARLAE